MMQRLMLTLMATTLLAGCDMAPHYARPASAAPAPWPHGDAYGPEHADAPGMPWRSLINDARLRTVIEAALANNRDLRAAVANVAAARAQYHVQQSAQLPTIAAETDGTLVRGIKRSALSSNDYNAGVGISSFEIDLFGRLRNETRQALETYLSTKSGMLSTRLSIVAETATVYATLASDRDLLKVARDTVTSGERSVELTRSLFHSGLASASDVQDAITIVEQARSDVENFTTLVAQDRNALELIVGAPVDDALLPDSLTVLDGAIAVVPAGLSSTILLERPDVLEAEHLLKGANAGIGAARAAFFPTITLTSAVGVASTALKSLFVGGALNWMAGPAASLPLLGGPNRGNLANARAQRDLAVAQYEKAVQSAFRDVADGLARRGTITREQAAQARLVDAASQSYHLADVRYRAGTDTFLNALTSQRTLYAARQNQIGVALIDVANRIALYQAIGSDHTL